MIDIAVAVLRTLDKPDGAKAQPAHPGTTDTDLPAAEGEAENFETIFADMPKVRLLTRHQNIDEEISSIPSSGSEPSEETPSPDDPAAVFDEDSFAEDEEILRVRAPHEGPTDSLSKVTVSPALQDQVSKSVPVDLIGQPQQPRLGNDPIVDEKPQNKPVAPARANHPDMPKPSAHTISEAKPNSTVQPSHLPDAKIPTPDSRTLQLSVRAPQNAGPSRDITQLTSTPLLEPNNAPKHSPLLEQPEPQATSVAKKTLIHDPRIKASAADIKPVAPPALAKQPVIRMDQGRPSSKPEDARLQSTDTSRQRPSIEVPFAKEVPPTHGTPPVDLRASLPRILQTETADTKARLQAHVAGASDLSVPVKNLASKGSGAREAEALNRSQIESSANLKGLEPATYKPPLDRGQNLDGSKISSPAQAKGPEFVEPVGRDEGPRDMPFRKASSVPTTPAAEAPAKVLPPGSTTRGQASELIAEDRSIVDMTRVKTTFAPTEAVPIKPGNDIRQIDAVQMTVRLDTHSAQTAPSPGLQARNIPNNDLKAPIGTALENPSFPRVSEFDLARGDVPTASHMTSTTRTASAPHLLQSPGTDIPRNISQQLATAVQSSTEQSVEILLNPAELGRVRINLSPSEAGLIVSINAERPEILDLLRRHAELLAQDFRDIGYRETAFSFGDETRHSAKDGNRPFTNEAHTPRKEDTSSDIPTPQASSSLTEVGRVDMRL